MPQTVPPDGERDNASELRRGHTEPSTDLNLLNYEPDRVVDGGDRLAVKGDFVGYGRQRREDRGDSRRNGDGANAGYS